MKTLRYGIAVLMVLSAVSASAQVTRQVPARPRVSLDFGSRFFTDLQNLFGRLQQSELDKAFDQAKPLHCSDLVGDRGDWKLVAFLNDLRSLGEWRRGSIEEVRRDLATYRFSGNCSSEAGPVEVATSYPIKETADQFRQGKIPFSKILIRNNMPVGAAFDETGNAYSFQLPFLYVKSQNGLQGRYTLTPPKASSKPDKAFTEEFRCKGLSDAALTYRFLLCRTRIIDLKAPGRQEPLGNSAYYILSDGKEASATVKLMFGTDTAMIPVPDATWHPAPLQTHLSEIASGNFRLEFDSNLWRGRIDRPQLLAGRALWDSASNTNISRNQYYCMWQPGAASQAAHLLEQDTSDTRQYTMSFRDVSDSTSTAVLNIANAGVHLGTLQCYFPQSTAGDISLNRLIRIVGPSIGVAVRD